MTDVSNPWLSKPAEPEIVEPAPSRVTELVGPASPQRGVPAPDRVDRLPLVSTDRNAELWCLGVHGGAGESSVAGLRESWAPAHHGWPAVTAGGRVRVLLVARSNMRGLRAAQAAATEWASGLVPHVDVVGLAIVSDAPGRLPRPLRDFAQVVAGGVPRSWRLPWIEAWRLGDPLDPGALPREVRRMLDDLVTDTGDHAGVSN